MFEQLKNLTQSSSFDNAVKLTFAAVTPVLLASSLGHFEIGLSLALGPFLISPADIQSSFRHKVNGLVSAALIVCGLTLVLLLLEHLASLRYLFAAAAFFSLSMISVYGHRASMISFSGLLAVCLTFGPIHGGMNPFLHVLLIFLGAMFYILVSLLWHWIQPHRYTALQLAQTMKLTAKYLKLRGDLWTAGADRAKIVKKQLQLQVELNESQNPLREVLLRKRIGSGESAQNRRMLMTFVSLVEILELALSTPFDHRKANEQFADDPGLLRTYQQLAYDLAATLRELGNSIKNNQKYVARRDLIYHLQNFNEAILAYKKQHPQNSEHHYLLANMFHYAEKQIERIKIVERNHSGEAVSYAFMKNRERDLHKFLAPAYYPWSTFRENLGFSSTTFRHALRLTVTLMLAFAIADIFALENAYWILLTIIVIMRPAYGLTKSRSAQRIVGTLAGGIAAFMVLLWISDPVIIGALTIVCMLLGFAFSSTHYRVGVLFITMYVVFLFGMITSDVRDVIVLRLVDTVIGAALAYIGTYILWPNWEFLNAREHVKNAIEANRNYVRRIAHFYNDKGEVDTNYRLARKSAFVEVGNLMSSFQRMALEPKSKQKQLTRLYDLAVLNHELLSAAASLGTYIQTRSTTKASAAFNRLADHIEKTLDEAVTALDQMAPTGVSTTIAFEVPDQLNALDTEADAQEGQLVREQLLVMTGLAENLKRAALKFDPR